jgi:CHAD domain-containing protein
LKNAREIDFGGAATPEDAIREILRIRFAECLSQQSTLASDDDDAIHGFRLACKRLRYAIERFTEQHPELKSAAELLEQMTDELGAAHDSFVLGEQAERTGADVVRFHTRQDRNRHVKRARRLWHAAFRKQSPFEALARYAGYTWQT